MTQLQYTTSQLPPSTSPDPPSASQLLASTSPAAEAAAARSVHIVSQPTPALPCPALFRTFHKVLLFPAPPPFAPRSGPSHSRVSPRRRQLTSKQVTNGETSASHSAPIAGIRDTESFPGQAASEITSGAVNQSVSSTAASETLPSVPPALRRVSRTASAGTDSAGSFICGFFVFSPLPGHRPEW